MSTTMLTYRCPHCGTTAEVEAADGNKILTCPSKLCGKPFQVAVPSAEPVPALIVPPDDSADPAQPRPVATPATPAESEQPMESVRLCMIRRYPFRFMGYSLLALAGVAALVYAITQGWWFLGIVGAVAAGYALLRLGVWWFRTAFTAIHVTTQRCILETGVLEKQSAAMRREDISDIQVHQNAFTRLFRVGDLVITNNNGEKQQLVLMAVPNPEELASHIRKDS